MKTYSIDELFRPDEINYAKKLLANSKPGEFNKVVVAEITGKSHVLARIAKLTGQENDPRYLGYLLEYALTSPSR